MPEFVAKMSAPMGADFFLWAVFSARSDVGRVRSHGGADVNGNGNGGDGDDDGGDGRGDEIVVRLALL